MAAVALPEGNVGVVIKAVAGLLFAWWWTSGKGADEASEVKGRVEKRTAYSRHYAFKGRGRKEYLRVEVKDDRTEIVPTRAHTGA